MCLFLLSFFFFFNDTATTEIYTLSLHDALPISEMVAKVKVLDNAYYTTTDDHGRFRIAGVPAGDVPVVAWLPTRSEEHTSELQSRQYLVCRLLLEKKKKEEGRQCAPDAGISRRR